MRLTGGRRVMRGTPFVRRNASRWKKSLGGGRRLADYVQCTSVGTRRWAGPFASPPRRTVSCRSARSSASGSRHDGAARRQRHAPTPAEHRNRRTRSARNASIPRHRRRVNPIFARRLTLSFEHRAFSASCQAALIHARQLLACVKRQSIIEFLGGMEDYLGLCVWHRHDRHAAK